MSQLISRITLVALAFTLTVPSQLAAEELKEHLVAGEFRAAVDFARSLPVNRRDGVLAQVAVAQASGGDSVAAAQTVRGINSAAPLQQAFDGSGVGAGGATFADFDSLMQLIQTTIVPDTWEALGGPSTMFPYSQGIYVDPSGTIRDCELDVNRDNVTNLQAMLGAVPSDGSSIRPEAWLQPSTLRFVSVRRMLDELAARRMTRTALDEPLQHLAGLAEIQYVVITDDDLILAGAVGGIESHQGWLRDRESGRSPIRLESLAAAIVSASEDRAFGCNIDPTLAGLQGAAVVAEKIQSREIPIGRAVDALRMALGRQNVEVFGTAADTSLAYLLVEADRHVKQLAVGQHRMPRGVANYLDMVDAAIAHGPPDELLLRLWFTAELVEARADPERTVFELTGRPIRLSGENERALASGERGHVTQDPRTAGFVQGFNQHWNEIRDAYPIYGALEAVFRAASVAELLDRHTHQPEQRAMLAALAALASLNPQSRPAPTHVDSIAVMHTVRHGQKRHRVLIASGGVLVSAKESLSDRVSDYPSLHSLGQSSNQKPRVIQRWWWDAPQVK